MKFSYFIWGIFVLLFGNTLLFAQVIHCESEVITVMCDPEPAIVVSPIIIGGIGLDELILCRTEKRTFEIDVTKIPGTLIEERWCTNPKQLLERSETEINVSDPLIVWSCPGAEPPSASGKTYEATFPKEGIFTVKVTIMATFPQECNGMGTFSETLTKKVSVVEVSAIESTLGGAVFPNGGIVCKGYSGLIFFKVDDFIFFSGMDPEKIKWELFPPDAGTLISETGFTTYLALSTKYESIAPDEVKINAKCCPRLLACPGVEFVFTVSNVVSVISTNGYKNGEILCKGESATIELMSITGPVPITDPSEIVWEITPSNAGTLASSSGFENIFTLNDDYRSNEANDVIISARCITSDDIKIFKLTIVEVDIVEWLNTDGTPLETNFHPDRDGMNWGGGFKIYPDKLNPNDSVFRGIVKIFARVKPPIKDVTVYFKVFDVDDATPATIDFDQTIDPLGPLGGDNQDRSNIPPGFLFDKTNFGGEAEVEFVVSLKAGDNYRVGCHCMQSYLIDLTDNDIPPGNVLPVDSLGNPRPGKYSSMLTVWRKLYIEYDSMEKRTGIDLGNNIIANLQGEIVSVISGLPQGVSNPVPAPYPSGYSQGPLYTIYSSESFSYSEDHFEGGRLYTGGNDYRVLSHKSVYVPGAGGDSFYTEIIIEDDFLTGTIPTTETIFYIVDDDRQGIDNSWTLPIFLNMSDHSGEINILLETAYADAYITPETIPDNLNLTKTRSFIENVTDNQLKFTNVVEESRDIPSQERYWTHLVLSAHQGGIWVDLDPDLLNLPESESERWKYSIRGDILPQPVDNEADYGITPKSGKRNVSLIFLEIIREYNGLPTWGETNVSYTFVHEIGHSQEFIGADNTSHHPNSIQWGLMLKKAPINAFNNGFPILNNKFRSNVIKAFRETDIW